VQQGYGAQDLNNKQNLMRVSKFLDFKIRPAVTVNANVIR